MEFQPIDEAVNWPSHWDNRIEEVLRTIWMLDSDRYELLMDELKDWPGERSDEECCQGGSPNVECAHCPNGQT